ncbi:unnamed protein product [Meloidogyne enterolobii]|uniref:Uncharacterized protein n=1 Tax=Meloidogyne enterolobii TaxID=390850 RepID=A0ACB0ZIE3_MELEN
MFVSDTNNSVVSEVFPSFSVGVSVVCSGFSFNSDVFVVGISIAVFVASTVVSIFSIFVSVVVSTLLLSIIFAIFKLLISSFTKLLSKFFSSILFEIFLKKFSSSSYGSLVFSIKFSDFLIIFVSLFPSFLSVIVSSFLFSNKLSLIFNSSFDLFNKSFIKNLSKSSSISSLIVLFKFVSILFIFTPKLSSFSLFLLSNKLFVNISLFKLKASVIPIFSSF